MYNIIIPTYNEKKNIKPLFFMVHNVFEKLKLRYKIILIDDNSPDGTYDEALNLKNTIALKAIKRPKKLGLGSAYKDALKHCEHNNIIILDADLSHDPNDIEKMIHKMIDDESIDIVIGSRYLKLPDSGTVGWNLKRKLTSRGANNLAQILLGIENSDLTGSYRLYKKQVFTELISKVKSNGYSYQMEILYLASINNYKVAEIPIVFHEREYGESKLGSKEIYGFAKAVITLMLGL